MLIVQEIRDRWSKEERRRTGTLRRGVPEVALLPLHRVEDQRAALLHHTLLFGIRRVSEPPERIIAVAAERPLEVGCVTITPADGPVHVEFAYTWRKCGAPNRWWARKSFLVNVDEWAQIIYNGRSSYDWTSYWYYEKTVVNVGLFSAPSPDLFSRSAPTYRYSLISRLR